MPEENNSDNAQKQVFIGTVAMLASSAMQQLGKTIDPTTRTAETDLEAAQATIDILMMLQAKTRGNLDSDEERLLRDTIAMLQMNYVQTASRRGKEEEAATPAEPGAEANNPGTEPELETPPPGGSEQARFHKSYG